MLKDFSVKFLYLGLGVVLGFLGASEILKYKFDHARIEREINQLDERKGLVCIAEGGRVECLIQRVPEVVDPI